jgi:hypothetical protein
MRWEHCTPFDSRALALANRHYPREKPESPQFLMPGRKIVLVTPAGDALWAVCYPRHAQHEWPGTWWNTAFRNENRGALSSELVREAIAATRYLARVIYAWGEPPELEHPVITMIDEQAVRPKRDPGRCYLRAGFEPIGRTSERDYLVLGIAGAKLPAAAPPLGHLGIGSVA